jgi:hypothetical protein
MECIVDTNKNKQNKKISIDGFQTIDIVIIV